MISIMFRCMLFTFVLPFMIVQCNHQFENCYDRYGYKKVDNLGYYKLHTRRATWDNAKQICESEYAHLAVLNSQEEANILLDLWNEAQLVKPIRDGVARKYAYLGIYDRNSNGEFQTIFQERLNTTGFALWSYGEPNDFMGPEYCGTLDVRTKTLNDVSCKTKLTFYCEKPIHEIISEVSAEVDI